MILECQEKYKAKVLKHGVVKKRKGLVFKKYKSYQVFLLDNGNIIFYTTNQKSKKFGKESEKHRIQLDETLWIGNKRNAKNSKKKGAKDDTDASEEYEQFTLRIGTIQTHFQSLKNENWVHYLENELSPSNF